MYKRKNKNKIYLFLILILVIFTSVFMVNRDILFLEKFVKDIVIYPFILGGEMDVDMSKSYLIQKNLNISLEEEITELKKTLELNKTMSEFDVVNSTIINRNNSYWFNTITIDKGSNSSIKKDMAVITRDGLVGRISKVYSNTSEVKLITLKDSDNKVSVTIKNNDKDVFGVLSGYDIEKNLLIVEEVLKNSFVEVGDVVVTSGLGGVFPNGIYIGEVKSVTNLNNLTQTLYVETKLNFNDFHYVSVLRSNFD